MSQYRGPKVVPFNREAVVRRFAKIFYREISKPNVRAISFVIERSDAWNIQSSHALDSDAAEAFSKASAIMRQP